MKLVIIGGTGLIGSKLVAALRTNGQDAVAASLETGVNTITGDGLADALGGADVVVDVSNSPSFEETAVMTFFTTSTQHLLEAAAAAGVRHYVALSVVGTERIPGSPYLRAKRAQELLIERGGVPYSIVHATQFFEFIARIADDATDGAIVRLPPVAVQPMAAADVADALARIALGGPINGIVEIAGPERFRFDDLIRQGLAARGDGRRVVADPRARYFGAELVEHSLVPAGDARIGATRLQQWLAQQAAEVRPVVTRAIVPIALAAGVRVESAANLTQLLADTLTLRDLYKKHHWQVAGPTFHQLHLLFDRHHDEQVELVDAIAERVQLLGGVSVAMAADVAEATLIPRPPKGREAAPAQIARLLHAHEIVLEEARAMARAAARGGDDGTNDLIVGSVIRRNELQAWFLAEHLVAGPDVQAVSHV